jgi:AcrR family transcriptional regulator
MPRAPVQDRAQATYRRLVTAARDVFSDVGFAAASMEGIAERAGVTRGPLYHYFDDKADLFRTVYELVERDLTARIQSEIQRRGPGPDALEAIKYGAQAFLDAGLDPTIQRIAFLEAPYVLARGAHSGVSHFGLALLRNAVKRAIDDGAIAKQPIEPLAHILRAAITEGAIFIARAEDQQEARREVGNAIEVLVEGLRAA